VNTPSELQPQPLPRRAITVIGGLVLIVVVLVALSLRRPDVPQYAPTPLVGVDTAAGGFRTVTVDTTDPELWRYVDLGSGAVSNDPSGGRWDLALRRFEVRVNGGDGFAGRGGALDLGPVALDSVARVPAEGYAGMKVEGRDTSQALLDEWYSYSFTSHLLTPKDMTLAIRTADGRRVALRFLSYYCPQAQPGCVTMRYAFR
jgi:hypothetical protein